MARLYIYTNYKPRVPFHAPAEDTFSIYNKEKTGYVIISYRDIFFLIILYGYYSSSFYFSRKLLGLFQEGKLVPFQDGKLLPLN